MKFIENIEDFKNLLNPPSKIYYKGNLELLNARKVAIIGSRKMSVYTKNCLIELVSLLKKTKVCVVSGGALGVDIQAAKIAYPQTIAIFANGLDEIYPKSNTNEILNIYENALALSENEAKYKAKPYDFLLRNRLIIALSEVVIIAQADLKSGSMQSARLALSMNKPIYVLPHRKDESEGTNLLLATKKANLIHNFEEFVKMFGELYQEQSEDDLLSFLKHENDLEKVLKKFGDRVYEYELEGLVEISGVKIRACI
ncbi:DNA-protecting protein DprA [Campylobacter sp. IFREMER_LSEM_CL1846]|uniref:DNA-protecting protein DprA n=1 Tax=unclassified Campylobacter TaxID=2593542 RepID=UPI00126C7FD9|nr:MULTISPECIES: DNA-protecting protein DprA [unclassified Campylobacter]EAJ5677335.1 DNA-processing protein DprA [Campylobacter lari]EAK0443869.1 DNA-processing protein DprA [Campylobacter lari]EAK9942460.1 DNA-processing protein DprA [Campylobacter lari]MCV3433584.1 DNA-protecting protein DprA [Campylobacter sp. IFREMER_LSEM_CL1846]MCV3443451.1 DNA-protecting protein DprA [Campylobacter sp. IFREMER_LSEM_CL1097]